MAFLIPVIFLFRKILYTKLIPPEIPFSEKPFIRWIQALYEKAGIIQILAYFFNIILVPITKFGMQGEADRFHGFIYHFMTRSRYCRIFLSKIRGAMDCRFRSDIVIINCPLTHLLWLADLWPNST